MAICLSRHFRGCSSFLFFNRRNQHSNSFDYKLSNSLNPMTKEMGFWCQSSLGSPRCDFTSKMTNIKVLPENVLCVQECQAYKKVEKESGDKLKRAEKAQLLHVTNVLVEDLPELFNKNMNFKIYHPNMVFENNLRGTKTVGVVNYMREIFILKVIGNIRFSHVKFKILKITDHPEDGTVRVRWRIVGVSQLKNILRMIKQNSQNCPEPEEWYDGFSIFYVRSDGLIHKHMVNKMIPENDDRESITRMRSPLAAKMAFAVDVSMQSFSFDAAPPEETHNKPPSKVMYSLDLKRPAVKLRFSDPSS